MNHATPPPTFASSSVWPDAGPVWNFNKISEIPILFHANDHPCHLENDSARPLYFISSCNLHPSFPLISPRKSWYSIRMVFKDSKIAGSSCPEIIDTIDEADRNDESSSTLGVARLLRCRYGRRKSARRRRKSAKSARRANGSCQTLIFRFSRLVPRLT